VDVQLSDESCAAAVHGCRSEGFSIPEGDMEDHWLAIDQGTTSSRAIIFDGHLQPVAMAQQEFPQLFPASGWVEHDAEAIWLSVLAVCRRALQAAKLDASRIRAIGIANQRETTLLWERASGRPIHNAIVW